MNPSKPKALLRSLFLSYLLSGILLLIMAFAMYKLKLKEAQINTAVYAVYVIACLIGGILSGKALQTRKFFWGMLTGLLYFLILLAASWLMKQGVPLDTSRLLTVLACCAAGGMIGGMIS